MSALASCDIGQGITSEAIAMASLSSQMDESPALLSKSIWVMKGWKVVLRGFRRVEEAKKCL